MKNIAFRPLFMLALLALFALLSRPVFADQSCYIHSTNKGTYTTGSSPLLNLTTNQVSAPTNLGVSYTWLIQFITNDPVGCKNWTPYDNTVHFINMAGSNLDQNYSTPEGNALIKTTVKGIDYTVELVCLVSDGCGSSHPAIDLFIKGANGTDNTVPSQSGNPPYTDCDSQWKLKFTLWVTPEFKPQKGLNMGTAIPGDLAEFRIGPTSQASIYFTSTTSTLQFTVPASSCSFGVAQGNTVSGNNVSLGDYWINDVKNGNTPAIPFAITLQNCYTPKLTISMTSPYVSSDKLKLGKSSGSADGVGVKIMNTDQSVLVIPNSAEPIVYDRSNDWSSLANLNFTAQLLTAGGTLKAGSFNAVATFQMDYE
jgi:P pilus assembly protein, pilin FimA